ncbi:CHASE2 domain-containing protein [bacterium]|nr:CHASE2 domain-containing protein [bacterium]
MNRVREIISAVLFGIFVALLVYAASQTVVYRPFLRLQNAVDDSHFVRRFKIHGTEGLETERIVIIDIDNRSIQALGRFELWPRRLFGTVIANLKQEGAELVFLDVILKEGGFRHDNDVLAESVRNAGNVISGYYFNLDVPSIRQMPLDPVLNQQFSSSVLEPGPLTKNQFIKAEQFFLPYRELMNSVKGMGFTNYVPDPDGVLRHIPLYIKYGRRLYPSASLQMWMYLKGIYPSQVAIRPDGLIFGKNRIPTDRHCFMRLNYSGTRSSFTTVSFLDVLNNDFTPGMFTGKIVLIGSGAEKLRDLKQIPGFRSVPGVEVHATALSTLLSGHFLHVTTGNVIFIITLLSGIVSSMVFLFAPTMKVGLPVVLGLPLGLYLVSVYSFVYHSRLVNITLPSFVIALLFIVITIYRVIEDHGNGNGSDENSIPQADHSLTDS